MPTVELPKELAQRLAGCDYIVGSDEVGYGAWAGPLTVCAVLVSRDWPGASLVRDSKALTPARRESIFKKVTPTVVWELINVDSEEIDKHGVYNVLLQAHQRAIQGAIAKHEALGCVGKTVAIVDGNLDIPGAISLPKADALVPAVSAASILAKVTRDRHMTEMNTKYPGYSFAQHYGYGVPAHVEALQKLGVCPIHRRSYAPIAELIRDQAPEEPREAWTLLE